MRNWPGNDSLIQSAGYQRAHSSRSAIQPMVETPTIPASSHGLPTSRGSLRATATRRARDLHRVDPGPMRRVALELVPAGHRPIAQLVVRADDLPAVALGALPDGQRQAVVALLADHPVGHVPQPVELALLQPDPLRQPGHRARGVREQLAQRVHGDEPLIHQPEDDLGAAAPADRVGVAVLLACDQQALQLQVVRHLARQVGAARVIGAGVAARLPAEALAEDAELVDGVDHRQVVDLGQRKVLLAAARGDVHDAGSLSSETSSQAMTRCSTPAAAGNSSKGPA